MNRLKIITKAIYPVGVEYRVYGGFLKKHQFSSQDISTLPSHVRENISQIVEDYESELEILSAFPLDSSQKYKINST